MKQVIIIALAISAFPTLASAKPLDWAVVESLGGARLGEVRSVDGVSYLDTGIDVSGTRPGAKTMNSGLSCSRIEVQLTERTIYLTAHTGLANVGANAKCPSAKLGQIAPGDYSVQYRSPDGPPHSLGTVTVP